MSLVCSILFNVQLVTVDMLMLMLVYEFSFHTASILDTLLLQHFPVYLRKAGDLLPGTLYRGVSLPAMKTGRHQKTEQLLNVAKNKQSINNTMHVIVLIALVLCWTYNRIQYQILIGELSRLLTRLVKHELLNMYTV